MRDNRTVWIAVISLVCSAFLFVQMGTYAAHLLFGLKLRFNLFDLCAVFIGGLDNPFIRPVISAVIWCTLATALWSAVQTVYNTGRAYRKIAASRHSDVTDMDQTEAAAIPEDCILVPHQAPAAFTIGLFKPKIVLTTGLLDLLDPPEVQAVIFHEQYHRRYRDPLVICMLEIASKAMWYIPAFKWVSGIYKVAAEIMADKHAMTLMGGSDALGGALLKMLKNGCGQHNGVMHYTASYASFAQSSLDLRIKHIINPQMKLAYRLPVIRCIVSVIGFSLLALLI
jgi:Zn-dependent protease with chaperone function